MLTPLKFTNNVIWLIHKANHLVNADPPSQRKI